MSNQLVPFQRNRPARTKVPQGIAQQVDGIEGIALVARKAADELSELSNYIGHKAATTNAAAELLKQMVGEDNPAYEEFSSYLEKTYLRTLAYVAGSSGQKIAHLADQVPLVVDNRSVSQKLIDAFREGWEEGGNPLEWR